MSGGGWQGLWCGGREGEGRCGLITQWVVANLCSGMAGGIIQAYVG